MGGRIFVRVHTLHVVPAKAGTHSHRLQLVTQDPVVCVR